MDWREKQLNAAIRRAIRKRNKIEKQYNKAMKRQSEDTESLYYQFIDANDAFNTAVQELKDQKENKEEDY